MPCEKECSKSLEKSGQESKSFDSQANTLCVMTDLLIFDCLCFLNKSSSDSEYKRISPT